MILGVVMRIYPGVVWYFDGDNSPLHFSYCTIATLSGILAQAHEHGGHLQLIIFAQRT